MTVSFAARERDWSDPDHVAVEGVWMRGGTSKCWIFRSDDLPENPKDLDAVLVRLLGSPDHRQIDGIGGASSTTSKVIVIRGADVSASRVDYVFGQVSVDTPRVEWASNCGNCASAVALYAVQEGLVSLTHMSTPVTLLNVQTGLALDALVDTPDVGQAPRDGTESIPGTYYPGVRVRLRWRPSSWSTSGTLLPTGNVVDVLEVEGRKLRATLVDAGAPAALLSAADLGVADGTLDRDRIERLLPLLMATRNTAAEHMGLSTASLQSIPKVGIVHTSPAGSSSDIEARMVSMTALHPAIGVTSAIAVAAAATIPGTIVHDVAKLPDPGVEALVPFAIGTLAGTVSVGVHRNTDGTATWIESVRSARRIADAKAHLGSDWIMMRSQE